MCEIFLCNNQNLNQQLSSKVGGKVDRQNDYKFTPKTYIVITTYNKTRINTIGNRYHIFDNF